MGERNCSSAVSKIRTSLSHAGSDLAHTKQVIHLEAPTFVCGPCWGDPSRCDSQGLQVPSLTTQLSGALFLKHASDPNSRNRKSKGRMRITCLT